MRIAYADPPYVGQAQRHYGMEEIDHAALIAQLERYDGWALSASSPSLRLLLPVCPPGIRIGAWVKPFAAYKRSVRVAYAWEPVLFKPVERRPGASLSRDFISEPITLRRGLHGAKPFRFAFWLFDVLGLIPDDELVDLFPGTGAVSHAWELWCRNPSLRGVAHRMGKGRIAMPAKKIPETAVPSRLTVEPL